MTPGPATGSQRSCCPHERHHPRRPPLLRPSYVRLVEPISRRSGGLIPQIDDGPEQDDSAATVTIGDDGSVEITIGGDAAAPRKPKSDKFDANLAEDMDHLALAGLCASLLDGIEADLQSRREWEDTANRAANYLGIKLNDPNQSVSVDGTVCQAIATCMLEAAVKSWSVARAELLPVGGPIKVRRDNVPKVEQQPPAPGGLGASLAPSAASSVDRSLAPQGGIAAQPAEQPGLTGDELAEALATDLNHYLTVQDREYYPDFSQMLMSRALIGIEFRKVYRCPLRRKPVSVWVKAQDLIVSNDCSHISGAGRVSERIRTKQSTMRRLQVKGHYRDIPLAHPTGQPTDTETAIADSEGVAATPQLPSDYEHLVYECCCEIGSGTNASLIGDLSDLEKDETGEKPGYPLPYRVSIDSDSREILEIRRNWEKGDEDHRARKWYVKYGFVPGLGFYNWGLIHLVGNPTQMATMIQRATVDSSLFANFPGGLILQAAGSAQQNTVFRPNPGQFIPIKGFTGQKIQDIAMPMPYREPSAQQMALATKAERDVQRLAGVIDIPVGEGRIGNTPVGTIMSYIEAISQVPGAIHKDDHISQQEEYDMLRKLIAEDPEVLTRGNKTPARRWQIASEITDPDLVPAADPNTQSQVHRLMKVQGLVMLAAQPQFQGIADQRAVYETATRVISGDDPKHYTLPPQPAPQAPPDPKIIAAQIKAQADLTKVQAQGQQAEQDHQFRLTELGQEVQERAADRQSEETRAAMQVEAAKVKAHTEASTADADRVHDTANAAADRAQEHVHHETDTAVQQQAQFAAPLSAPGI